MLEATALPAPGATTWGGGKSSRKKSRRPLSGTLKVAGAVLISVLWMLPVIFVVMASVKNSNVLFSAHGLISIPTSITWSNFTQAWGVGTMSTYMRNSAIITAIKVPIAITIESLLAYSLAYKESRLRTFVFGFVLVGMIFPPQAALVPLHGLLQRWHIFNTWVGLILVYLGFGLAFGHPYLAWLFPNGPARAR